ncbi:hypothetical protein P700755_003076 [Psychroflexus torquis ATCC 700755]|uniref:Lipoprotein n=1 Tax=Psychroflexus torquis (strain ATCC 700755 / CIP 106069 / ACAM 623) TaxID=313595 RepID=K4IKX4_PSYTT|nr:hypothetical protein [Psychroflexus torquis]AFU69746.1 hypothetical protein P700755_003076 [Psychroflexus torquis ATCC 700755]
MKHFYVFGFFFILLSCQTEEFFEQVDETSSLTSLSELTGLISRLNQNPTAFDDFIDNSNSLSLEFPYEITINSNNAFTLNEFDDYQAVINELISFPNDYSVDITFPVQVSLPNYELLNIENEIAFFSLLNTLEGSTEINCLEYTFPIQLNVFDSDTSFINERSVQNEAQFFNFLDNLQPTDDFYEIAYPIEIRVDTTVQIIVSNLELEIAIRNLAENCFNPSLFINNSTQLQQFIAFITSGEFKVTSFIDEEQDETDDYDDFVFTFNTNNTISVVNTTSGNSFTGEWTAEIDEDELIFELDFESNELLEEFDEDWVVDRFSTPNTIELSDEDTDELSFLIFEKL